MNKTNDTTKMASSVIAYVGGFLRTVVFEVKGAAVEEYGGIVVLIIMLMTWIAMIIGMFNN